MILLFAYIFERGDDYEIYIINSPDVFRERTAVYAVFLPALHRFCVCLVEYSYLLAVAQNKNRMVNYHPILHYSLLL